MTSLLAFAPWDLFTILGPPIDWALVHLTRSFSSVGPLHWIGPFGLAVICVTLIIRVALFPVFQWQLKTTRRIQAEQRLLAPQMQALRKKYKGDPKTLQEEMMKLYREHDISPLSQASGCLPLLVQMPILYSLYNGVRSAGDQVDTHKFLWIDNLSKSAADTVGGSVTSCFAHPTTLILPLIAAAATFMQSKMMLQPPRPNMSDQERTAYSMGKNMVFVAPLMVGFMGLILPQALPLYWATQSLMMIGQQWYLLGWGALPVPEWFPGHGRVTALSINQPPRMVAEAAHGHGKVVQETKPIKPAGRTGNGAAAPNGAKARTPRAQAGKGARPPAPAGSRPAGARPPSPRPGSPPRGGKRRRGR